VSGVMLPNLQKIAENALENFLTILAEKNNIIFSISRTLRKLYEMT
jgi:hypothetical protein